MPGRRTLQQLAGTEQEAYAEDFLRKQGLSLICKNYRCKLGEIDLIMQDGEVLVFVEVRLRSNVAYGSGAETVTLRKQRKTINTALIYLQRHPHLAKRTCRFDVISSQGKSSGQGQLTWIKDAYQLRL